MSISLSRALLGGALAAALGAASAYPAAAQRSRVVIPANTIVRAELLEDVHGDRARRGDRVTARLDADDDTSGFPDGTRFEGVITEVQRASRSQPAMLDMRFDRAILPGGSTVAIRGELASLADDDIRRTSEGRLESRRGGDGGFDWKWVGIGAGGGAVLGQIFGGALLKGALLGGLGGAIYSYLNRDRDGGDRNYRDIDLDRGTEFGMVLESRVALDSRSDWRYGRGYRERVAGSRSEYFDRNVRFRVNDRVINFATEQPTTVNGVHYVPLQPIAEAAGWRVSHRRGIRDFTLNTPRGVIRGQADDRYFTRDGTRYQATESPIMIEGQIYVPLGWLSLSTNSEVNWNRSGRRVDITTR